MMRCWWWCFYLFIRIDASVLFAMQHILSRLLLCDWLWMCLICMCSLDLRHNCYVTDEISFHCNCIYMLISYLFYFCLREARKLWDICWKSLVLLQSRILKNTNRFLWNFWVDFFMLQKQLIWFVDGPQNKECWTPSKFYECIYCHDNDKWVISCRRPSLCIV